MAETPKSILKTVKNGLLIVDTYTAFDQRIIDYINTAISTLIQIGYYYADNFEVTGEDETWSDLIPDTGFNMVKTFVVEYVSLLFDPPTSSFALDAKQKCVEELEVRIRYKLESGD